jgi:hypothetical protein
MGSLIVGLKICPIGGLMQFLDETVSFLDHK